MWRWLIPICKNSANDILINTDAESQTNLVGNARASPVWIAFFHVNDSTDQFFAWAFRPGFFRFDENSSRYFRFTRMR